MTTSHAGAADKAATGISGLDDILAGGWTRQRIYVLEGTPGTGKTTISLQFLLEGAAKGERGLYITLSETEAELRASAYSHGWELPPSIEVFELVPAETLLDPDQQQTLLFSSDLELGETTRLMFEQVERSRPDRVVLDSLSEIRLLAQGSLRYRRQILSIKHYFSRLGTTVLLLDDLTSDASDKTVHSIAHGVLRLEELAPDYGAERRRLRIIKYRGQAFRGGYHDFSILHGGIAVYPRLVSLEHKTHFNREPVRSTLPMLDEMLGGGIDQGSSTVVLGPSGSGKSLLTMHFVASAIARGEKAAMFVFDEELGLTHRRAAGMGFDMEALVADGRLFVEQVDAAELSPGEFTHRVRSVVDAEAVKTVVIDSLNGFQTAMPQENSLLLHLHELLQYLNRQGASTFVTVSQHGVIGDMRAPIDVTYLADAVILLRFFEASGRVRRVISVLKKRSGAHLNTIHEFTIGADGFDIGAPLQNFEGVLRGMPSTVNGAEPIEDASG